MSQKQKKNLNQKSIIETMGKHCFFNFFDFDFGRIYPQTKICPNKLQWYDPK